MKHGYPLGSRLLFGGTLLRPCAKIRLCRHTPLLRHIQTRLPKYIDFFKGAADIEGLDWRLLAAIGYQESHWNPKTRSPTGVDTMRQLGLHIRLDPRESILGSARYLAMMKKKLPERIPEPDRTWLALTAYNANSFIWRTHGASPRCSAVGRT